ncbi:hypothetical protein QEG73_07595 [Chitinophagaceae bacterium 26-R-25]|nr:hypothetical protein [Chitinophagaceae bacterium 26-R-25]
MVTTDTTQFSTECTNWKNTLRSNRERITQLERTLLQMAPHLTDRESQHDIEHFQNQFRIQLLNVHDLKHDIKNHEKFAEWEMNRSDGHFSEATYVEHEDLNDRYHYLESVLDNLQEDFKKFSHHYTA